MSFLAPEFLVAAIAGALGVVALHFLVTRRPRSVAFPTARFVPDVPAVARARSIRLSDLLLLAVRVVTILLAGAALARPVVAPRREQVVRVIAADVSGSVANVAETRDSVRSLFRPGDAIVLFDTIARSAPSPDSIDADARVQAEGSLSTALIAALRAGSRVRYGADSVELVLVSPVTLAEHDKATKAIRALWSGRARLVKVAGAQSPGPEETRDRDVGFLSASRPRFAVARNRIDTVGAVVADGNVVVARFERRWRFVGDSLVHARVIARWVDGDPAAIAMDSAFTCIRSVAIPVDSAGDMVLRPSFVNLRSSLSASCRHVASAPDVATTAMLAGTGGLAQAAQFPPPVDLGSPTASWLAGVAIVLAIIEMVMRRSRDAESEP